MSARAEVSIMGKDNSDGKCMIIHAIFIIYHLLGVAHRHVYGHNCTFLVTRSQIQSM